MLDRVVVPYDIERYPFERLAARCLRTNEIETIHLQRGSRDPTTSSGLNPRLQQTIEQELYSPSNRELLELYRSFIVEWVCPLMQSAVVFQAIPNFRIQLPGGSAVPTWHKDLDFGHDAREINFWVPLTATEDSTSLWVESQPGKEDFTPARVSFGSALIFDGANLTHGNTINATDLSRLSFDFRVIRREHYVDRDERSVRSRLKFSVGHYFDSVGLVARERG